jgi:hypothetical protein
VALAVAECRNGLDDDGDGLTDFPADPGCADENDLTERLVAVGPGTTRVIIDDFESGDFSLTTAGAAGGESIAQGSLPVLGGSRESAVMIRDSIPGASATIAVGGGFGTWSLTTPGFVGAAFRFWYDRQADGVFGNAAGPYVDLTSGGADRFLLEVATVTGLVHLDIQIFDSRGFNKGVGFTPPDGGACEIYFSSFVGVDFTSVRNVVLGHRPLLFTDANTSISFASFATAGPPSVVLVEVEIKPGGEGSPINLRSKGVIPVAILGSESFDPSQVDVTTLAFGPAGAAPVHESGGHLVDVDADGFIDLLSHYRTQETGIAFGDSEACVSGELFDAMAFEGCDAVHARPIER